MMQSQQKTMPAMQGIMMIFPVLIFVMATDLPGGSAALLDFQQYLHDCSKLFPLCTQLIRVRRVYLRNEENRGIGQNDRRCCTKRFNELQVTADRVNVTVLEQPSKGLFGLIGREGMRRLSLSSYLTIAGS